MRRLLGPGSQGHCLLLGPQPGCALMATRRHEALSSRSVFATGSGWAPSAAGGERRTESVPMLHPEMHLCFANFHPHARGTLRENRLEADQLWAFSDQAFGSCSG